MPRIEQRIKFGRQQAELAVVMVLIIKFCAFPRSFVFSQDCIQNHVKET